MGSDHCGSVAKGSIIMYSQNRIAIKSKPFSLTSLRLKNFSSTLPKCRNFKNFPSRFFCKNSVKSTYQSLKVTFTKYFLLSSESILVFPHCVLIKSFRATFLIISLMKFSRLYEFNDQYKKILLFSCSNRLKKFLFQMYSLSDGLESGSQESCFYRIMIVHVKKNTRRIQ